MKDTRFPQLAYEHIPTGISNPGRPKERWKTHKTEYSKNLEMLCILFSISNLMQISLLYNSIYVTL